MPLGHPRPPVKHAQWRRRFFSSFSDGLLLDHSRPAMPLPSGVVLGASVCLLHRIAGVDVSMWKRVGIGSATEEERCIVL